MNHKPNVRYVEGLGNIPFVGHMPTPPRPDLVSGSPEENTARYDEWLREFRKAYNACGKCLTSEHVERMNYDMMWGDADLVCKKCFGYVRMWDRD